MLFSKNVEATAENLKIHHMALYTEVCNAAVAEASAGRAEELKAATDAAHARGVTEGGPEAATAERDRIMAVYDRSEPGYAKEIKEMMADGRTTGPEAGDKLHMATKVKREAAHKSMKEEAEKPVDSDHEGDAEAQEGEDKKKAEEGKKDFMALVGEYQKEHKCSKGEAISAVAGSHPDEHAKYVDGMSTTKA